MSAASLNGAPPRDYAAGYSAAGLCVLPIRGDGSKAPTLPSWTEFRTRRPRVDELRRWFLADSVGVAILHGAVSGNSECIDVDNGEVFEPFVEEVRRLAPGLIAKLTTIKTPRDGGGFHLVFRCSEIEGSQKLARRPDADDPTKPKVLIETKGEGGYTLAPGCPGCCHPSGGEYEHIGGPPLTELPTITPEERKLLLRVARSFNQIADDTATTTGKAPTDRGPGLSPGDDYNLRATWNEILSPHGWTTDHASGDRTYWRRPGKDNGWTATTGLKSTSGTELFCCFSDNAHPFTGGSARSLCTSYSKFAAYAVLNHGGDYSAAAKQLASEGYGEQKRERVLVGDRYYDPEHPAAKAASAESAPTRIEIVSFPLCEFVQQDHRIECKIEGLIPKAMGGVVAAKSKGQKTSISCATSFAGATGVDALGRFRVPRPFSNGMITGESGAATISETYQRIAKAHGIDIRDVNNLHVSVQVPQLRMTAGLEAIERFIDKHALECLWLDPTYLAFAGVEDTQLSKMAEVLAPINKIIERTGCSVVLVHHNRKTTPTPYGEPTLEEIGGTGYAQWARFWILLNKRREWDPVEGRHWLWFCSGSSAGFGHRYFLDVHEGRHTDPGGRIWVLEFTDPSEGQQLEREQQAAERESTKLESERQAVCGVLAKHPAGLSWSKALRLAKVSNRRWDVVKEVLADEGDVVDCEVIISNQKTPQPGVKLSATEIA